MHAMTLPATHEHGVTEALPEVCKACLQDTTKATAEKIWTALYSAASSYDYKVAWCRSPIYKHLEAALTAAIKLGWGLGDIRAERVLTMLAANGETIAYNVDLLLTGRA